MCLRFFKNLILNFSIFITAIFQNLCVNAQSTPFLNTERQNLAYLEAQFDTQIPDDRSTLSAFSVLSTNTIYDTYHAIEKYQKIVDQGGFPLFPEKLPDLHLGSVSSVVPILRKRLYISGDFTQRDLESDVFDTYVQSAVKHFQSRYGLVPTGIVGNATYKALVVPANIRLQQLEINYARLKPLIEKAKNDKRFIMVNIPDAILEAVEEGLVIRRYNVVVGKANRQTPVLTSQIEKIIFNPTWTVPPSIVRKDLIPLLQKEPFYLYNNRIHVYNARGQEIVPKDIDWYSPKAYTYTYRQESGKNNAMASTKISFPNSHSVYMHDTPEKDQFINAIQFDSSGCVRIQNIRELDQWLLKYNQGWNRGTIEETIASQKTKSIALKKSVPLYFSYITAWSNIEDIVNFRDDIYKKDIHRK